MKKSEYFAIRGVIEGFYGRPWAHSERLKMLQFMGQHGYNAYFYSPKNDPYLRDQWQKSHPVKEMLQLDELIAATKNCNLSFFYCVSPGLSIEYSNEEHFEQLCWKYKQMCERGVTHFALLFDDIPLTLIHEQDKKEFEHLADAHVQITLKLISKLKEWKSNAQLIVCPTMYNGMGSEPYVQFLGENLPQDILIFWTGRFVCSPFITEGDAKRYCESTGHKPILWDNYPVNDLAMADELHIGPLLHRDPELFLFTSGYVSNAMELVESSKIPLVTIADYLHDPFHYDAENSWQKAVREVAGTDDYKAFLRFADNVRSSFLNDVESPYLMKQLQEFRFHFVYGNQEAGIVLLRETFLKMEQTAAYLLINMKNQKLAGEIEGWIKKLYSWANVGKSVVALIDEGRRGRVASAVYHLLHVKRRMKQAERLPYKVCGSVMKFFVDAVLQEVQKKK